MQSCLDKLRRRNLQTLYKAAKRLQLINQQKKVFPTHTLSCIAHGTVLNQNAIERLHVLVLQEVDAHLHLPRRAQSADGIPTVDDAKVIVSFVLHHHADSIRHIQVISVRSLFCIRLSVGTSKPCLDANY